MTGVGSNIRCPSLVRHLKIEFVIKQSTAWAPGLETVEQWVDWAKKPFLPVGHTAPDLLAVPAMQRRRLNRLGRLAIQTAYWCDQQDSASIPKVFASRHGDVAGSLKLLENLVANEPMSPTEFSLSVHNAIPALYSIIRGDPSNYTAIAAGAATAEAAMVEAAGLLADGAAEVLVVCYSAGLPEVYHEFFDQPETYFAWSWRIASVAEAGVPIQLSWEVAPRPEAEVTQLDLNWSHELEILRWFLSGETILKWRSGDVSWRWRRDA